MHVELPTSMVIEHRLAVHHQFFKVLKLLIILGKLVIITNTTHLASKKVSHVDAAERIARPIFSTEIGLRESAQKVFQL